MSKKVAVIGAGISGLAVSRILKDRGLDCTIFEKKDCVGGIARPRIVSEVPYHLTGGHCFNSKEAKVKQFVFDIFPESNWNHIERVAKIYFKENLVDYPIEFSLGQIAKIDPELSYRMFSDLVAAPGGENCESLESWFIQTFGETLAREYFIPYNKKVWNREIDKISPNWVAGKLPVPNKLNVFLSLFNRVSDGMPHQTFYYPKSKFGQIAFIESLAKDLNIRFNYEVNGIKRVGGKWIIDGSPFDLVVSTVPLNTAIRAFGFDKNEEMEAASKKLTFNSLTNMLWTSEETERTWTYFPSSEILCHRHIHIGNFLRPAKGYTITEAIGVKTKEAMIEDGRKIAYLHEPLDYHVSEYAYVVSDNESSRSKKFLIESLELNKIYQLGRFGEWEYYNMDICILSSMNLAEKIVSTEQ